MLRRDRLHRREDLGIERRWHRDGANRLVRGDLDLRRPPVRCNSASVPSTVSPGKMRQLTLAVARCGSAFSAWPASSSVATQVVRSVECNRLVLADDRIGGLVAGVGEQRLGDCVPGPDRVSSDGRLRHRAEKGAGRVGEFYRELMALHRLHRICEFVDRIRRGSVRRAVPAGVGGRRKCSSAPPSRQPEPRAPGACRSRRAARRRLR